MIALEWGDIQFGEGPYDPYRYIYVQRNYSHGQFTTPKNRKPWRVDLSKHLRQTLLDSRDKRMLEAMAGRTDIADDLVFPRQRAR